MKLLVVDDETLTREEILSNMNLDELGITEIYQADNGVHGFELARKCCPDIVLSNVHMPRMTGVQMAFKIREISPDSSIIFMSGYSDKEKLKTAIQLKAVTYVKKPIDPAEMNNAIKQAVKVIEKKKQTRNHQTLQKQTRMQHLAISLIYSNNLIAAYPDYFTKFQDLGFTIYPTTSFTTFLLEFKSALLGLEQESLQAFLKPVLSLCHSLHFSMLYVLKQNNIVLLHVFSKEKASLAALKKIGALLKKCALEHGSFFLTVGKTVGGIEHVYESYNSAVILLHSTFFYPYNSELYDKEELFEECQIPYESISQLKELFMDKNQAKAMQQIDSLFHTFKENRTLLVNHVKDFYYKLFFMLTEVTDSFHIIMPESETSETILDVVSKSETLSDLHTLYVKKVVTFFELLDKGQKDTHLIFLIKDFIGKNYKNDTLSIKLISEHVFLSTSYLCTIFKTETGRTLNQYITDYRIEKAKKLLSDPRNKIVDVASRVGYTDCNYFGKSFKKIVGLSPSEYREQNHGQA